ncbi:MAG: SH3 domain-containing protein, partial [Anaerolineae bacterium]|nr:SH3 domain-containing protein [Anaerolineae bacterium]
MARKIEFGINLNPRHELGQPADASILRGLRWVRVVFAAASLGRPVEQALTFYDQVVARYRAANVRTLFVLNGETFWGHAPWDHGDWERYAGDFSRIAGQIAAHYTGQGVAYEIWNEGDVRGHSSIYVPPAGYAALLAQTSAAIRAADPNAPVIFGGLAADLDAAVTYVQTVRDQLGGSLPVDALGVHPYGKWPPNFSETPAWGGWFGPLEPHLQRLLDEFPALKLWITEVGISEPVPFPRSQYPMVIKHMRGVYDLIQRQFWSRIPVAIWFAWSDIMRNAGIVDGQGQPKPELYDTFFALARSEPPPAPEPAKVPLPDPASVTIPPRSLIEPTERLNMRAEPMISSRLVAVLDAGAPLTVIEPWADACLKLGCTGYWINVVTGDNQVGWVAAWLVRLADPAADPVPSEV